MQLLPHEIPVIKTKLSYLKHYIDEKHTLAVEAGEQSTENMMHDDAPQQIAVEEGRVVQAQYDALRKILHEAEVIHYPSKRIKRIQIGHRVEFIAASERRTIDIVGYPTAEDSKQISPLSPLGKALIGKRVGDNTQLNGKPMVITAFAPLY